MAVKSNETQAFLKAAIPAHFEHIFWLGATDRQREGDFKWIDAEAKLENLTITNWRQGEPNNGNGNVNEDCVNIKYS